MERASDYAVAAAISPLLEFASVLVVGFTLIYFGEWTAVPGLAYALLLVAPVVSSVIGLVNWQALHRDIHGAARVGIMHGLLEGVTLMAAGAALAFFLVERAATPAPTSLDARVLDLLIASAALAVLGAAYGLAVFLFAVPLSWSQLRRKLIG